MKTQWSIAKVLGLTAVVATAAGAQEKAAWNWSGEAELRAAVMQTPQAAKGNKFDKALQVKALVGANGSVAGGKVDWNVKVGTMPSGATALERHLTLAGGNLNGGNNIGIDQASLNFHVTKRVNILGGKFANPFTSGGAIFDPDFTPEGIACGVDVWAGTKTSLVKNVTNTAAWLPLAEIKTKTADPMMLADQLHMNIGKVPTALALYYSTGLKNLGQAKDAATVLDLTVNYDLPIAKFPINLGAEVFGNVSQSKNALGYELKVGMSKCLTGALGVTYRNVQTAATLGALADNELGAGTGYKALRVEWQRPVWKTLNLDVQVNHWDGYKKSGVASQNNLLIDLGTKF